jgi:hypothetical protein
MRYVFRKYAITNFRKTKVVSLLYLCKKKGFFAIQKDRQETPMRQTKIGA